MNERLDVLVAEDNELNRKVLSAFLELIGVRFSMAEDGAEALSMITKHSYDIVLMDVRMPNMTGIEVAEAVRNLEHKHPHMVAVTGNVMDGAESIYSEAGFDDYLPKPVSLKDLTDLFERFYSTSSR